VADIISKLPESLILGVLVIAALFVLLMPLALKFAGLTAAQIVDVLTMTTKFFIEIVREFRNENKSAP